MKTRILTALVLFVVFAHSALTLQAAETERYLPKSEEIFTIKFYVKGKRKESRDIFSEKELSNSLKNAVYLGHNLVSLKEPLDKYYWNQEGVMVLNNKNVYSFTIYEDRESNKRFIDIYFANGKGVHLYSLPENAGVK